MLGSKLTEFQAPRSAGLSLHLYIVQYTFMPGLREDKSQVFQFAMSSASPPMLFLATGWQSVCHAALLSALSGAATNIPSVVFCHYPGKGTPQTPHYLLPFLSGDSRQKGERLDSPWEYQGSSLTPTVQDGGEVRGAIHENLTRGPPKRQQGTGLHKARLTSLRLAGSFSLSQEAMESFFEFLLILATLAPPPAWGGGRF